MRQILVIGGRLGISSSLVQQLAGQASVIATSRTGAPVKGASQTLLFDAESPDDFALDHVDRLDGVVYCPGTISLKPFRRFSQADFLRDYQINVLGAVSVLQKALPLLERSDQCAGVVLFSTVAAKMGMPFHASIASAKAAVEGLVVSLAAEFAPKVRVNAIAPSLTDTPLAAPIVSTEAKLKASEERHPLKQIGDADDIASLAVWLLSDQARFVTGQVINADGGMGSITRL